MASRPRPDPEGAGPQFVQAAPMTLLPPAPGKCPLCAVEHPPWQAHNAQSLFYQMRFQMAHGRAPRWSDAIMHCAPEVRQQWAAALGDLGAWTEDDAAALNNGTAIAEPVPAAKPTPEPSLDPT